MSELNHPLQLKRSSRIHQSRRSNEICGFSQLRNDFNRGCIHTAFRSFDLIKETLHGLKLCTLNNRWGKLFKSLCCLIDHRSRDRSTPYPRSPIPFRTESDSIFRVETNYLQNIQLFFKTTVSINCTICILLQEDLT